METTSISIDSKTPFCAVSLIEPPIAFYHNCAVSLIEPPIAF